MAHVRTAEKRSAAHRVAVIAPESLGATAIAALRRREIEARTVESVEGFDDVIAWALAQPPSPATAVQLASACARAAAASRPVCVYAPAPSPGTRATGRAAIERAAALAHLRAAGAAIAHDVDAWLESIVLLVRYGLPAGPHAAVIAPAGSWLEAQALAAAADAEALGQRGPSLVSDEPTDAVLYDPGLGSVPANLPGLHVPVTAIAELGGAHTLHHARAAIAAIGVLGRAAERIAVGLGPAEHVASAELGIDHDRVQRQLAKLVAGRVGDHETKVLLAAYGVPITRQAVATTPSAAVKTARRAGFPVEIKPWGHDVPTERANCPVERDITSDALVRKAYTAVLTAAGRGLGDAGAVIVRQTPPVGRVVSAAFVKLASLGWTVVLDVPGAPQIAAAPAPLRAIDAKALASHVVASRAGDPEPDRLKLADLLRRTSHLVVDLDDRLVRLELPRIVVGGGASRTLVVDAFAELG
jgi:hypothetical protein